MQFTKLKVMVDEIGATHSLNHNSLYSASISSIELVPDQIHTFELSFTLNAEQETEKDVAVSML
jgi:hypothetical protein